MNSYVFDFVKLYSSNRRPKQPFYFGKNLCRENS